MAVASSVQSNAEDHKIPNASLTGIKPDLCHKCELKYTFANVRIEKAVETKYNEKNSAIKVWLVDNCLKE